jgi:NADH-quinone oxidoreductase subunit L
MFLGLGATAYTAGMFHVITHAFFKALLFLGAGSVIHAMSNEQDIRNMGGLRKALPVTFITFAIGTWAIAGLPPFAGFFSKDEILAHVFEHNKLLWALGVLGSGLTSFYMFRLLFLTVFGEFRGTDEQRHHLHESPASMTVPLMVLAALSALGGLINLPGGGWLSRFMAPLFDNARKVNPEAFAESTMEHSTEYVLMAVSAGVALLAFILAYVMYISRRAVPVAETADRSLPEQVVYNKYYIDELYDTIIVRPIRGLGDAFYSFGEGLVDGVVNGIAWLVQKSAGQLRLLQNGSIGFYVLAMVVSIAAIFALRFFIRF